MNIKQLKKELNLTNKDLADLFDMSLASYANSTAKERYESALCKFYEKSKDIIGKEVKLKAVKDIIRDLGMFEELKKDKDESK